MQPLNDSEDEAARVRELNRRFHAGEWVRVGFERRAFCWQLDHDAFDLVHSSEFVDWSRAWWQPLIGLLLGGGLLAFVVRRERRRRGED